MIITLMATKNPQQERIKKIIRQFSGGLTADDELIPEYAIKGSGTIWCYHPSSKVFIRVTRGIKVFIIEDEENQYGRVLVYTSAGEVIEIELEELIHTGFD
jgi:hypothetical protein